MAVKRPTAIIALWAVDFENEDSRVARAWRFGPEGPQVIAVAENENAERQGCK
jgi:hypothetical protein